MADHELRQRLDEVASVVDAGDLEVARDDISVRVGRRRTRRRVGAAIGAVAVVAAVTTAVLTVGGDDPDTLVSTADTEVPTSILDDNADNPEPTLPTAPPTAGQAVDVVDGVARVGSPAGTNGAPEYGEWMLPWEDGFLVGSMSFPPQPLPDELPEEVIALFPQEVIDVFGGDLPDTISEATQRLSDAGLLDVVGEIIANNPEAYDAIYGNQPDVTPTLDVRFTTDGETWEPRAMVLPAGATYFSATTAVDDRIAAVYSIVDPVTGMPVDGRVVVATTTDLTTWTTQEIAVPTPPDLPQGVTWSVYAQGLVANDSGWVVPVYSSVDIDAYSLVPADVRATLDDSRGLSVGTTAEGITIESGFDDTGDNPAQSVSYTWEELGIDPDVAELVAAQDFTPTLWAASWDGVPAPADAPSAHGPIAATAAGFVMWTDRTWFSPDGANWTSSPLPTGVGWVSGAFGVDGGLVVLSETDDGSSMIHRVDERGGDAVLLDLGGLPEGSLASTSWMPGSAKAGAIVTVTPPLGPEDMLSVEVEGYRLTLNPRNGIVDVTEILTGVTVVSGSIVASAPDEPAPITFDDSGITVTDPDTGDVLVMFPAEVLDAAGDASIDNGGEYTPDFWLLASLDGQRFVIDDLDDADDGPMSMASNGDRLLVQAGRDWLIYDLT